jgi:hypothetical protein
MIGKRPLYRPEFRPRARRNSKLNFTGLRTIECCRAFRLFLRRYSRVAVATHPHPKFRMEYRPNFPRISPLTFLRDLVMIVIE